MCVMMALPMPRWTSSIAINPSGGPDKIQFQVGPQKGFALNFLSFACDPSIKADYYAFCDQDDVWLPEKLNVAVEHMARESSPDKLYAYGGRTTYMDEKLKPIGLSPLFVFPRTFRSVLIQIIASGNTMVFNQATNTLLEKVGFIKNDNVNLNRLTLINKCHGKGSKRWRVFHGDGRRLAKNHRRGVQRGAHQ